MLLAPSPSGSSCLVTMMSGEMPICRSSLTECWVGLVFCSPEQAMYGTSVTWTNNLFSRPTSLPICLAASRKGWLSMSPIVPPISVSTISAPVFLPTA